MLEPICILWEAQRYSWNTLRAAESAANVPEAIYRLATSDTEEEANRWYWEIDNVVMIQGAMYEAAVPAVTCMVIALPFASLAARHRILEFLSQAANGYWSKEGLAGISPDLPQRCQREILRGAYYYLGLLSTTTPNELEWCVDLLANCAKWDTYLIPSVKWHYNKLLEKDQGALTNYIKSRADIIALLESG